MTEKTDAQANKSNITAKTKSTVSKGVKKTTNKAKESPGATVVGIGIVAALAAGTYYFYGAKDASKNRKKFKGWMLKMKGEVLERVENLKDVNEEAYNKVVDTVADKYQKAKKIDPEDVLILAADLKRHWRHIKKDVQDAKRDVSDDTKRINNSTKGK